MCAPALGDTVAVTGENHKLLIFPRDELPVMTRGKGVILQRFKDGSLCDVRLFDLADGLVWRDRAGREHREKKLADWIGKRGQAGRLAPRGFPRNNKFG